MATVYPPCAVLEARPQNPTILVSRASPRPAPATAAYTHTPPGPADPPPQSDFGLPCAHHHTPTLFRRKSLVHSAPFRRPVPPSRQPTTSPSLPVPPHPPAPSPSESAPPRHPRPPPPPVWRSLRLNLKRSAGCRHHFAAAAYIRVTAR